MTVLKYLPGTVAVAAVVSLAFWLGGKSPVSLEARVPGVDRPASEGATPQAKVLGQPKHMTFDGKAADLPGSWPWFRGPARDGIAANAPQLLKSWAEGGPKVLWSIELGEGYAGAAVRSGRVFVLDYDRKEQADAVRCFSLADGKEIWRYQYPVPVKRNHGMSRTVPAVTEKYVVGLGPKCHVTCLDVATGELQWQRNLVKDFHAKVPPWYAGQCPLVEGNRVILGTGGDALLVAVDIAKGDVLWKSPNPAGWRMTHSSVLPVDYEGKHLYVYCGTGGVAGVSAEDGAILWQTDAWKIGIATVPTPVSIGEGKLFFSGGYNAGSLFLTFRKEGGRMVAEAGKRLEADAFGSTQQTPIFYQDHLYGVRPDGQLVCLDLDGKVVWASGADHRFGLGPYMIADGMIFVLNDSGTLTLARAAAEAYQELARAEIIDGHDAWAPMALAGTRFLLRDFTRLVCLELKKE